MHISPLALALALDSNEWKLALVGQQQTVLSLQICTCPENIADVVSVGNLIQLDATNFPSSINVVILFTMDTR